MYIECYRAFGAFRGTLREKNMYNAQEEANIKICSKP